MTQMIDEKALEAAGKVYAEMLGARRNSAQSFWASTCGEEMRPVIEAYEAARLASLPADLVDKIEAILEGRVQWLYPHMKEVYIARIAALAALPEPQEVSEEALVEIGYEAVKEYPRIDCKHPLIGKPDKFFSNGPADVIGESLLRGIVARVVRAIAKHQPTKAPSEKEE